MLTMNNNNKSKDDKIFNEEFLNKLLLTFIILTLLIAIPTLYFGYKSLNGETCKNEVITLNDNPNIEFYTINNNQQYYLEQYSLADDTMNDYVLSRTLCTTINISTPDSVTLSVINNEGTVLGTNYFIGNKTAYKACIDYETQGNNDYLGLKCDDCDISRTITLLADSGSVNTNKLFYDNGTITVINDNSITSSLNNNIHCKYSLQNFLWSFLIMSFLFIILGLLILFWEFIKSRADKMMESVNNG